MALDWSQCPAVESVPGKVGGAWVFKGTRMPVAAVSEDAGFDVLLTTDTNPVLPQIVEAVNAAKPGTFTVVEVPQK